MKRISLRRLRIPAVLAGLLGLSLLATACSAAPDGKPESDAAATSSYTVTHAMGEQKFDSVPERIVVLDSPPLDALVALGITPVGAPEIGAGRGFPAYLADKLKTTKPVGFIAEPDIDAIANLAPDLIIGSKVRHEALYDELSAIAPTVFSADTGTNWTEQAELRRDALDIRARIVTTPPQPPKLTIVPPPAPAVLSWNHNPPPPARYIYGRIIAVCVDCGEETWWLRGRSTEGGDPN